MKETKEKLAVVREWEDITFSHIIMAENILKALGLDHTILMEACVAKRQESLKNKED